MSTQVAMYTNLIHTKHTTSQIQILFADIARVMKLNAYSLKYLLIGSMS